MSTSAEPAESMSPHLHLVEAARRFFQEDPARILTVASRLRAPDRTIESTVLGMSMGRTIPAGSRIRIDLGPPRRYAPGEVIAFVAGEHVVVHRVVRRARRGPREYMLTRGDAALAPDPPIGADRVLGAVTAIHQDGQWTSVARRAWRPFPTRVLTSVVCALVVGALHASPRAAEELVRLLHRRRSLMPAALRPPGPSGHS
jgi:signal peptidase I